jgi:hypothetical protein
LSSGQVSPCQRGDPGGKEEDDGGRFRGRGYGIGAPGGNPGGVFLGSRSALLGSRSALLGGEGDPARREAVMAAAREDGDKEGEDGDEG